MGTHRTACSCATLFVTEEPGLYSLVTSIVAHTMLVEVEGMGGKGWVNGFVWHWWFVTYLLSQWWHLCLPIAATSEA